MIHVLHAQDDSILGFLDNKGNRLYWNDSHTQGVDGYNVLQFTTYGDTELASHMTKRARLVILGENDYYQEFIVYESNTATSREMDVIAVGSETELNGARIITPTKHNSRTTSFYVNHALSNTEWTAGNVENGGVRTIEFVKYVGAYDFLQKAAQEFDMELVFRVTVEGNRITGRYVDMVHRMGNETNKEFRYGKDLIGVERKVFSDRIVTGVFAIAPASEDGTQLTTTVIDDDAYQRWNRNGQQVLAIHEVQSQDSAMTPERLETLARMELNKRLDAVTEYEVTAISIEDLFEGERVRLGDQVRVIDTEFTPPLYATARVISVSRTLDNSEPKVFTIGNVVEYDVDDLRAVFRDLYQIYGSTVIRAQYPPEGKDSVIWIDTSGNIDVPYTWDGVQWIPFSPTKPEDIGAETPEGSAQKAEIEAVKSIQRTLNTAYSGIDLEYDLIVDSEYIENTIYRTDLVNFKSEYDDAQQALDTVIAAALIDDHITPAERADIIDAITTMESLQATMQWALTRAYEAVAAAQAEEARLQAELADQAAQDALEKADTALTEVTSKVDQSAFDSAVGDILDDLDLKADITYVNNQIAAIDVNITTSATAPDNPEVDDLWFDTTNDELKRWDGTEWVASGIDLDSLDVYTKTEIDNALNGYVEVTTYTADKTGILADIQSNSTAIQQNANEIELKANQTDVDFLDGTVNTHTTLIQQNADAIALKANSSTVGDLEIRMTDAEFEISDSSIISKVTNSVEFELMLGRKANADDLTGYATSDALNALLAEVESMGEDLDGIRFGEFVTQSELEQRDLSLIATISASSGVNLIKNSVGLARMEHWTTSGSGSISSTNSNELNGLGYHSGFLLVGSTSGMTTMRQDVEVISGKSYTLSFALRNINTTGDIVVRVLNAETGAVLATAPTYSTAAAGEYGDVSIVIERVPTAQLRVEINVPQSKQAIITALMLNIGTVPFSWTTAVGELYNTTIKMDLNGLRVSQYEDDIETGFTVMTPEKFAGYYNSTGIINENDGSPDEVFRMDKDEFVMKKATVKEEITMGTYKVLNIDEPSRKGWAFVPIND